MVPWGPKALPRPQRMALVQEIAERVKERFHPEVFAIGLYGSLARQEDGPYSDIELFAVLRTDHYQQVYEWCTAAWKAEVDLYGKQTLLDRAARVEGNWPLTHSAFQTVLPLYPRDAQRECAPHQRQKVSVPEGIRVVGRPCTHPTDPCHLA